MIRPIANALLRDVRQRAEAKHLRAVASRCDAFLTSYPKCGRTWLRYLLSHYLAETVGLGFQPDLVSTFRILPNFDCDPVRGVPAFQFQRRPAMPLVLISHRRHDAALFADRPIIFLIRDPRDIMVSAYFHATRHKRRFGGTIGAFLRDRGHGLPALISYWNGWAKGLLRTQHLILSYEGMLSQTEKSVAEILNFIGLAINTSALRNAIAAAQFDRMQEQERAQGIPGHEYDRSDVLSLRMRSGKAGSFPELLGPQEAEWVIARCNEGLSTAAWRMFMEGGGYAGGRHRPTVWTTAPAIAAVR